MHFFLKKRNHLNVIPLYYLKELLKFYTYSSFQTYFGIYSIESF